MTEKRQVHLPDRQRFLPKLTQHGFCENMEVVFRRKYLHGHPAGDTCLKMIGATLQTVVGRASDVVARCGGEEFVVILPETEKDGAVVLAERILQKIEDLAIPHAASETAGHVTVSLGVVTVPSTMKSLSPDQIVALADSALHNAKNGGRNRFEISRMNAQTQ